MRFKVQIYRSLYISGTFKALSRSFISAFIFILCISWMHFAPGVTTLLNFNEGTGTIAADISGNGHNGTLVNGPLWVAGQYSQGVSLDGINDYVNIADHPDFTLNPAQSYSWSGWVKNNNLNEWSTVWSQTLNATNFFYFYAHTTGDAEAGPVTNGLSVYWFNGANKLILHSNDNVLIAGRWSYITVTYDASQAQSSRFSIYVNGVDVTNRSDVVSSGTITSIDPTDIRIGSNQPFGEYLNGSVDEVRYYKRLISVAEMQSDMNTSDTQAPTVNITAPSSGNVAGAINVTANASDNVVVTGVQFLLDGNNLGIEDIIAPFSVSWNTLTAANGSHTLTAIARDATGNTTTSAGVTVTVNNDLVAPVVNITAPATGNVAGTINVDANATDNFGVIGVQFLLDGNNLGAEDVAAPYSVSWNTLTIANGSHILTARARDAAGNSATSAGVTVTVNNDILAPTVNITGPSAGNVAGTINVDATATDNFGVVGVQFLLDGNNLGTEDVTSPYSVSWNSLAVANGSHTLTARARDAAGNSATSAAVTVNVNNDLVAPTVSITAPAAGEVAGTISVDATATDNFGVVGVQFLLDGNNLGTEDVNAPYSISWNTLTVANGSHTLTAIARDAAGNSATSAGVIVTVNNDLLAPTVNIIAPAAGNVAGTINVDANATDNFGVVGVQFLLDGNNLGTEDVNAPYSISWNTLTVANGSHTLTAIARDAAGNSATSAGVIVTVNNDLLAPTVNIIAPAAGNVAGTINVDANATDNFGVVGVQFLLDGNNLEAEDVTAPYSVSWNTLTIANGSHTLTAIARDAAGNSATSAGVIVTVNNDLLAPTVNIIAPAAGNVAGTINVDANATDNFGVVGVQFLLDGNNLGTEDVTAPYSISWNTLTIGNGSHALTAIARDAAGNSATSAAVTVTVNNDIISPSVNITSPTGGNVSGTINVDATASDNFGVTGVQFLLDGNNIGVEDLTAPYSVSWNTLTATSGSHTLTARARDAAGNSATSAGVIVTVNNDLTSPTVNITAPASGNVFGTINVSANANDNIEVAGVQFLLDGNNLGAEDVTAPYSLSWNTSTAANGSHTLTARARDAAGNSTTSASISVTVNNDILAPSVNITAPAAGNVSGTINVTANASDNIGVAGVQFLLDGNNLGAEDVAASYSVSWNTLTTGNGNHTLTAIARDAAGNSATSSGILVTVNNDLTPPAINITAPSAGNVSGTINVTANASDNAGVAGVQFLLDGLNLGSEDISSPYSISWATTGTTNGTHTLTAIARDSTGNSTTSAGVIVTVNNDLTAPVVNITAPATGNVSGTINVDATATDNIGVVGVQFLLDGTNLGAEDVAAPYSVSWNTLTAVNGLHTLTARARDAAGNITTSQPVMITVSNAVNLIAAINFNEGTGTNAADISGNSHNGTLSGATWLAGRYGQGVNLNGTSNYVSIADHNNFTLTVTQNYTWSAWVKNTNFNNWGTVWSQTLDASNYFYFYAHSTTDAEAGPVTNGISVFWYNGANKVVLHSNDNVLTAGTWSYITVTYDASQAQASRFTIYVNGVDVTNRADVASSGTIATINPTNIRIGSNQPFGEYLNAAVDEAKYYNRLLSVAEIQSDMNTPIDNTAPTANVTSPANGATVTGTINVTANASDNVGIAGVQFLLDGNNLGAEDVTSPYSISWNTTSASFGNHNLTARVRDITGNFATSAAVTVSVNNDLVPPTITLTAPPSGIIAGTVDINASASDNIGVIGVQFLLNGVNLGAEDLNAPYSFSWNTNTAADGQYTIAARARDAAGNTATTTNVNVIVHNVPDTQAPSIILTSPAAGIISGIVAVTANASDNIGIAGVQFMINGINIGAEVTTPPYALSFDTHSVPDAHHLLSARARDIDGNLTTSSNLDVIVYNTPDTQPPSITLTTPAAGIVAGIVNINANASDNIAVAGVQFLLNGVNLGSEDTTAPYSFSWNTNSIADGNYILAARARDIAGNTTTTANIMVTVRNDSQLPTVTLTTPLAGTVANTINVSAVATDNIGVAGVQFLLNGSNLGTEDLTPPYTISWNTRTIANGSYTLSARARDVSGNIQTSSPVVVNVLNLPPDTEYPVVTITSPTAGDITGTINVTANATDNVGVVGVQFFLNGTNLGAEYLVAPYTFSWNTYSVTNGTYSLTAMARDAAGNITISDAVNVNVNNVPDTELPTVTITSPAPGNVIGTINVAATASDNIGVAGVQFLLDGNNLGIEDITAPYSISWNTGAATAGNHILSARARDVAGNVSIINYLNVNVLIPNPPVSSGISVSAITATSAVITWTTNIPATSQVIYDTIAPNKLSTLTDPALVISHSIILLDLTPGKLYHYQVVSADSTGLSGASADNTFTTATMSASLGTLNGHTVFAYPTGKIIPWTPNPANGYDSVVRSAWNYLLNTVPNDPSTGKPAYYSRSYLDPNTQAVINWPHNPAGLYAMLIESANKYYTYSGDTSVMRVAKNIALWHIDHGMTLGTDNWPGVPYASGDAGSLIYDGADVGNSNGQGDGDGYIQPDKIGELGYSWLQLYKYDGNIRFRDAAIQAANVLSNKIRVGTVSQSPWPYRVNAHTGAIREEYCSNIIAPISLLDGLIAAGIGDTAAYRTARNIAWNWMMTYPMQNNAWAQYFEDVGLQSNYNSNLNQYNAMMTARYLLEHPELDPSWEVHVRGLITWVENNFGQASFGATTIKEQQQFFFPMGSHTSRYAAVNALLYDKTGDTAAKEKAYRSFNWATYMARSNGVVIDGPDVNNQWFTDGYGDYIRHFMTAFGAVPEWSPFNQTHLLRSSSVVKNISYKPNSINYKTYDANAIEVLHINFNPGSVFADGIALQKRSDLSQPGWTLDLATKTLRIYHNNATQISIYSSPASINSICPGSSTYFILPKQGNDYAYQWQIDSTGTGFVDLINNAVHSGANTDTLLLNTPPGSNYGFKYRCIASKNGATIFGTLYVLKFAMTWQGNVNTAWENAANWSCGSVPDAFTDVTLSGAFLNNPVINSNAIVHSLITSPGAVLTINAGVRLDIKGK